MYIDQTLNRAARLAYYALVESEAQFRKNIPLLPEHRRHMAFGLLAGVPRPTFEEVEVVYTEWSLRGRFSGVFSGMNVLQLKEVRSEYDQICEKHTAVQRGLQDGVEEVVRAEMFGSDVDIQKRRLLQIACIGIGALQHDQLCSPF